MSKARCYLCNSTIFDGKVYEHMFEKRYNADGIEQRTLANILCMALGFRLKEEFVHSTFVCSTCKVSLINYEAMEGQLMEARLEILQMHNETLKLQNKKCQQEEAYLSQGSSSDSSNNWDIDPIDQYSDDIDSINDEADILEEGSDKEQLQKEVDITASPLAKSIKLSCPYCSKIFARRQWLEDHERVHTGERPYKCDLCEVSFAQRANLRSHMMATHQNKSNYRCNYCDRSFKRKRLLDNHVKSKHTLVRDFECKLCDAAFISLANLSKHMLCHTGEKNYSCRICGKQFSRLENRNVHHFVHSNRKPYTCVVCDEGYMRKHQLQQHIATSHHPNPKIVRRQPEFSAANNGKLLKHPPNSSNK